MLCLEMTSLLTEGHRNVFFRFSEGKFELTDSPPSVRPVQFDENQWHALIKGEPLQTPRELTQKMANSRVIVSCHLHLIGKVQTHGACVPQALPEKNIDGAPPLSPVYSSGNRVLVEFGWEGLP